jgi:outer membrane protein assembly factor BamB
VSERRRRLLPRSKRVRVALALLVLAIAGAALGGYLYQRDRTGSIYHPGARFVDQGTPGVSSTPTKLFSWPIYGYTPEHTRFFPARSFVRPPFETHWVRNGNALLEFPPVIYGNRMFQLADNAVLSSYNIKTGHTFWSARLGKLSASTPAVSAEDVYATVLGSGHPHKPGRIVALNAHTGHIIWFRSLPSPSESSPLLDHGRLFFGSQNGTVYALDASTGRVLWTYHASGSVKASPTIADGHLYFGDYSGHVQAISAQTGRLIWRSSSEGTLLGSGTFYSTAAAIYGRIFLGNTDGRVYAYDAVTGKLDWAVQTGAYVYASPAVTNAPGLGPTIYLGSYDGVFYALNARSGHISWRFDAGGKISGSATIIGNVVYFADLGEHRTYGLGISTGRVIFTKDTGAFDPVISDGSNIYLTGLTGVYALTPVAKPAPTPKAKTKPKGKSTHKHAPTRRSKRAAAKHPHAKHHTTKNRHSSGHSGSGQ